MPTRFLLAWLVPAWLVFELSATKLPHYVLPLCVAIAILIAGAVETNELSQRRWVKGVRIWWLLAPILLSITAIAGAFVIDRNLVLPAWPFLAAAIVCGFLAWRRYDDDGAEVALTRVVLPGHTDRQDLFGFLPSRRPAQGRQAQGDASRILRLAHPVVLGHPKKRFDRIGADRQADVIEP